jgi:uroporphyrinogen III methyltransferase / synthase
VTVYLVGAGPGDPGLLTRRGARLLARADVVLHDRLVSPAILDLVPPSAELIDVGKDPDAAAKETARQEQIIKLLIEHGRRSQVVVRLKGGDPFVFGRGGEETEALTDAGIAWQVVPGVTSAFGVPASVGIPVTQRGLASSVTVVTGRVGDHGTGAPDWAALARAGGTLVILMGMTTRAAIAEALVAGGRSADTPVAVIERGTMAAQRVERTTLERLGEVELGAPAVIVVGDVAALGQEVPGGEPGGPLSGLTVVATRSGSRAKNLVDALERVGAEVVELPLTRQVDAADDGAALRAAADAVWSYGWVVLTSVNAVDRFMAELRDARALGSVSVAALGPATADALRLAGVEPDLMPAEHSARGLVEEFPAPAGSGAWRVLFPCADLAPGTIPDGLRGKGWHVDRVEAYRTVPVSAPEPEVLARVARADAVAFTASSSVHAFVALRGPDGEPVPVPGHVVCIGPTTAAAARAAGMGGVREAWGVSADGIVAELVDHFGGHEGGTP